jgi:hypothetical protein
LLRAADNPTRNTFFNMDCVSCHTTGNITLRRLESIGPNPKSDAEKLDRILITQGIDETGDLNGRFPIPQGITGYIHPDALPKQIKFAMPWSVRNFGYFEKQPTVGTRTVNESAEVANEINQKNLRQPRSGPNSCRLLSSTDWARVEPKLWECAAFGAAAAQDCIKRLCSTASAGGNP